MSNVDHRRKAPVRPSLSEVEYLEATRAPSTRREYANDVRLYIEAGGSIPATVDQIVDYVTDIGSRLSVSTIKRRLVSIHVGHLDQGYQSPVSDARVKQVMKGVRRSVGVAERRVSAIEKDILLELWSVAAKRKPVWGSTDNCTPRDRLGRGVSSQRVGRPEMGLCDVAGFRHGITAALVQGRSSRCRVREVHPECLR